MSIENEQLDMPQQFSASVLAEQLNKVTERDVAQLTFKAYLANSFIIEKFSTWLLVGVGASCALMIANINSISKIVEQSAIKNSLLILVVSGLFGFLSKFYSLQVSILLNSDEIFRETLSKQLVSHIEEEKKIHALAMENKTTVNTVPDIIGAARKATEESVSWYNRKKAIEGFDRGVQDPLYAYKRGMRFLSRQVLAAIFEFACFLVFVLIVALSL